MLNKVILIGNATRAPELKNNAKTSIADMSIAINRKWKSDGETREDTTFVDVTLFGRTAEIGAQYVGKGDKVCVEGRLQMDKWEDKATGQNRQKLKVVADHLILLGSKQGGQSRPAPAESRPSQSAGPHYRQDDDVPF
jgi:single-strand DNA-binding protein